MQLQDSDDIVELKKAYSTNPAGQNRSHRAAGTEQLVAPWRVGTEGLVDGAEQLVTPWRGELCGLHFSLGESGLCSPRIER